MARSQLKDAKGPLARALGAIANAGPADVLAPLWAEVVGPLSARSRPVRLSEGVLTVEADPQFLPDLQREAGELLRRLNERLGRGAVQRIILIRQGGGAP